MRNVLKTSGRWLGAGWVLPLALLALPNCTLDSGPYPGIDDPPLAYDAGSSPTSAIMCEIPKPLGEGNLGCATPQDVVDLEGLTLAAGAVMLASGTDYPFALDWSQGAQDACGDGVPKKKEFFGTWPDGLRVCINCESQIDEVYATPAKACIAKCKDLLNANKEIVPVEGVDEYCVKNAKVALNVEPTDICYPGACTEGGMENSAWVDPRRAPEAVDWTDHIGTAVAAGTTNDLERTATTTGTTTADFNAGAASTQTIREGDAWVEFAAHKITNKAHVLGVRESVDAAGEPCLDVSNCPDTDATINAIGYAIVLNTDGQVYVFEIVNGALTGQGPFFAYDPGQRFRVKVTDRNDGKATISYERMVAGSFNEFASTTLEHPRYPLRVDTSFREQGAIIENATIMRIK